VLDGKVVASRAVILVVALMCTLSGALGGVSRASAFAADQAQGAAVSALITQADQRIRELQAETDRLAQQSRTLLNELRGLELQRQLKAQDVKKAEAALAAIDAAQKAASARLSAVEALRVAESPGVRERLVEIYKRGRGGYLSLLLRAEDLSALGRMARGVASVAQLDRARFDAHRRTIHAEQEAVAEVRTRQEAVAAATAEAGRARAALDQAVASSNRRIDQLDRERDLAATYAGELQEAQTALQAHVGGLSGAAPGLPIAPFRGSLPWPVSGRVISPFGRGAGPFGAALVRNGIEIAAAEAEPVRAVHGGTVAYAAPFSGFGTLVIVDHGAQAFTLYGHLTEATVAQGAGVARGAVVGRSGRSPAGQPAVYFELRIDGRSVDPVQWLRSLNPAIR
jgi:septal ring factor EnvC (AmiA/AmiB activator)